ncbi:MAG: hypothetical protein RL757_3063 [Bacteroidota bacterium]
MIFFERKNGGKNTMKSSYYFQLRYYLLKNMKKLQQYVQSHQFPTFLMRFPNLILAAHGWHFLLNLRNWHVARSLLAAFKTLHTGARVVDAGCGDGLHLFPSAWRHPPVSFVGLDKNAGNLAFCQRFIEKNGLKNIELLETNLENWTNENKKNMDLIYCVGTLQYIPDDEKVLKNFANALKSGGKLLIYTPINERYVLKIYKKLFQNLDNYEKQQQRTRIYTESEITEKLEKNGFRITKKIFSHGVFGILSYEIYNIFLLLTSNSRFRLLQFFYLLGLAFFLPLIFLLKIIDFCQPLKNGNGLLIETEIMT